MRHLQVFALAVAAVLATSAPGLAQSTGEAVYKSKCQNCHGPTGLANAGIGKAMKVKPITDPEASRMTEAEMIEATRVGMGKMQAYKGSLTEAEIRASVLYFRSFLKR